MVGEIDWKGQQEAIKGLVHDPGVGDQQTEWKEIMYITTHIWNFCTEI